MPKVLKCLTISPLKRLQVTQESDFNTRFQIPTVVINDDTSGENDWWNMSIFSTLLRIYYFRLQIATEMAVITFRDTRASKVPSELSRELLGVEQ